MACRPLTVLPLPHDEVALVEGALVAAEARQAGQQVDLGRGEGSR